MKRYTAVVFLVLLGTLAFSFQWCYAQPDDPQPYSRPMVTLLSWLPILVLVGAWLWFMRSYLGKRGASRQFMARSERHMTEVEDQLKRIVTLLENRDSSR